MLRAAVDGRFFDDARNQVDELVGTVSDIDGLAAFVSNRDTSMEFSGHPTTDHWVRNVDFDVGNPLDVRSGRQVWGRNKTI